MLLEFLGELLLLAGKPLDFGGHLFDRSSRLLGLGVWTVDQASGLHGAESDFRVVLMLVVERRDVAGRSVVGPLLDVDLRQVCVQLVLLEEEARA